MMKPRTGACPCLFANKMAKAAGVYLWTVNIMCKERPWYVGRTRRSFGQRMGEHIAAFLSGQYPIYDVAALLRGEYRRAAGFEDGVWPEMLPSFLRNFERLVPDITELMRIIRFHVAPLDRKAQLHDRVEGAIGRYYKAHADPDLRDFFSPGLEIPVAIPYDTPKRLVFSSETPIAGLPLRLQA